MQLSESVRECGLTRAWSAVHDDGSRALVDEEAVELVQLILVQSISACSDTGMIAHGPC